MSGIARYLLDCKLYKQSEVTKTIEDILTLFIELSYKDINNKAIMETDKTNRDSLLKKTKNGYLDTGLAHGLCGPLMILSIALEQGYELPNQRGAIEHSLEKLTKLANLDENSILNWSGKIEPSNNINSSDAMYGWCYGLPGIARTMWVSAQAIQSQLYMNYSLSLFKQLSTIPIKNLNIKAAPFCHGYSGLLTILYLMYLDTKDPDFQKFYNKLLSHIFDLYEESNLLSFCDYNHQNDRSLRVGLLEGTSGIILSINSITKNSYPQWAKAFLLF
ncbi:TPA: hypothetical protein RJJ85_001571 [Staphylococcus pseudintermedius]|nr:hypothetical protein [Staphylococcus pseudintermedius]